MRRLWTIVILAALTTAGCLGALQTDDTSLEGASATDSAGDLDMLLHAEHDHTDTTAHEHVENFTLRAHNPLIGTAKDPGAYTEVDVHGDMAVVTMKEPTGGFVLVDISNPDHPEVLSTYESGPNYGPDTKFGPQGEYVFIATHGGVEDTRSRDEAQDLADDESPIPYGVQMVDITDPRDPEWVSYMHCGTSGVHNVETAELGGSTWVFGACYDSFVNRVVFGEVVDTPAGPELVRQGEFSLGGYVEGNMGSVHDMVVNEDPITGEPVLTVSAGGEGVVWVDVTDPTEPEMLGQWKAMAKGEKFLHYAELYETTVDGRRITVAAPEYWSHTHSGYAWIIDTTDYDDPQLLSKYRLDSELTYEDGYLYSPHNFQLHEGTILWAHNHAGLVAVDFASTPERLEDPRFAGVYLNGADPGHDIPIDYAPDVWGVDLDDEGNIYVSDRGSGLHVVTFDG